MWHAQEALETCRLNHLSTNSESLDELQTLVADLFSPVVDFNVTPPKIEASPYRREDLGKLIKAVPVKVWSDG